MKIPLVDLRAKNQRFFKKTIKKLTQLIEKGDFVLGKELELFEQDFAKYCRAGYAVGVGSGTEALHLALLSCGIGKGDEVVTAANTFAATAEAIYFTGARPVLADIDPENYNIDFNCLEKAITPKTKAILPVHLYGQAVNMDRIREIAASRNLLIIEDACQAHGAEFKGKKAGTFGQIGAFSFYPGKNLGAFGEGGAVVTNNRELAEKVKMLRNHGQKQKYLHEIKGLNGRLDNLQAAVLRIKLRYLDGWNRKRNKLAEIYNLLLKETSLIRPKIEPGVYHIFHLYVVRSSKRDKLISFLKEKGIFAGIHYPIPIHLLPAFKDLGYKKGDFPICEKIANEILSLPMYPSLTRTEVNYIVNNIKNFEKYA